jgi:hypothetical protein
METKRKHQRIDVNGIEKRIIEVLSDKPSEKMDTDSKFILKFKTNENHYDRRRKNTKEGNTEDVWD